MKSRIPDFPFGAAPLVMLITCILTFGLIIFRPFEDQRGNVSFWVFSQEQMDAYESSLPDFAKTHPNVKVNLQLVQGTAVAQRVESAFWADLDVPDLVEIPIDYIGALFRGPLKDIAFMDLTDKIHQSGLWDRVVKTRFAPYTSRGRIFGLPHDVHPVMIAYRQDIFEQEGIEPDSIETWDDFVQVGRKLTKDLDGDGVIDRYMIDFIIDNCTMLSQLMVQRGGGLFDADGELIMSNEIACDTMMWYVRQITGKNQIANSGGSFTVGQMLTQAIENGYYVCLFMPDWRTKIIEKSVPRMAGKFKLMPLPAWTKGARRTTSWGGTMLGIPKAANTDIAWELAMHAYYKPEYLADRFSQTNIIPPLKEAWQLDVFMKPDAYWCNQPIGALFARLADQVPPCYTAPYYAIAYDKLSEAQVVCAQYYREHGEEGFRQFVQKILRDKADYVRRQIERNPYR
ncbi:MAG: ABC transporter substrate-binding protein [Planctomycetota bacterium]